MAGSDKDKLQKLIDQRNQLEERIKRQKMKLDSQERQRDTRRKILAGAYLLEKYKDRPDELKNLLDKFLSRPADRELFHLNIQTPKTAEEKSL